LSQNCRRKTFDDNTELARSDSTVRLSVSFVCGVSRMTHIWNACLRVHSGITTRAIKIYLSIRLGTVCKQYTVPD